MVKERQQNRDGRAIQLNLDDAHYFLQFIFFGLIAGLASFLGKDHSVASSEAIWLFVGGVLGIVVTQRWLNEGKFAKPYDFIIGETFTLVGFVGVLGVFKIHLLRSCERFPCSDSSLSRIGSSG